MLWVDYREKLGIGFSDTDKFDLLQTKVVNALNAIRGRFSYGNDSYLGFCIMVGYPYNHSFSPFDDIIKILATCESIEDFLSKYIGFINTFVEIKSMCWGSRKEFATILTSMMDSAKIGYEIQNDKESNEYFVFPQGASELDDALVSEPLEWLSDYPISHKTFINALKQYSSGEYLRDTADNFRKALESFLQEFFNNSNNLDTNKSVTGRYLKDQGADKEISDVLVKLIDLYKKLNDKIAKHNDRVDARFLEFLMYQTGLFIRMLIVVKRTEKNEAEG